MRAKLLLSAWLLLALQACILAFSLSDRTADVESTDAYNTKAPSPGQAIVVRTAKEFSDAVRAGHPHIELQAHLFFTAPTLNYLGIVPDTVQSIRGNCDHLPAAKGWAWKGQDMFSQPEAHGEGMAAHTNRSQDLQKKRWVAPKRPLVPRQCVIGTNHGLMVVVGRLWLDGVYIRRRGTHARGVRPEEKFTSIHVSGAGQLWATDLTLQGDNRADTEALRVGSKAFCRNTLIADHKGSPRSSPVNVTIGATLSLLATTITSTDSMQPAGPGGLDKKATGASISAYSGSKVRLQGCALQDNKVAHELEALSAGAVPAPRNVSVDRQLGARYYADVEMSGLSVWRGGGAPKCPLSAGPAHPQPLQSVPSGTQFLGEDDEWFVNIQRALPIINRLHPPALDHHPLSAGVWHKDLSPSAASHAYAHADGSSSVIEEPSTSSGSHKTQLQRNEQNERREETVSTKEELYEAINRGVRSIVLLQHLDLSIEGPAGLSIMPDTVQSLRGNCTCLPQEDHKWEGVKFEWATSHPDEPCGGSDASLASHTAPLPQLRARQCVIEVQQEAMHVVGRLMVEGVAFRRSGTADVPGKLIQVHGAGELYMRDVTLQGGGGRAHDTQPLHVSSAAFAQGLLLAHTSSSDSAVSVDMGATLSLRDSCMHHMNVTGNVSGLVEVGEAGQLWLQEVTLKAIQASAPEQVFVGRAARHATCMYSDEKPPPEYCDLEGGQCVPRPMKPLQAAPPETEFLASSDTWLQRLEEMLGPIDRESEPQCGHGGFVKRAMHVLMWLDVFVGALISLVGLFVCCGGGFEGLARCQAWTWRPIKGRLAGLLAAQRQGPQVEEVGAPDAALLPPAEYGRPIYDGVGEGAVNAPPHSNDTVQVIDIREGAVEDALARW